MITTEPRGKDKRFDAAYQLARRIADECFNDDRHFLAEKAADLIRQTLPASPPLSDADARIAALEAELSKAQAFKTWVHSFLDGKGVPADPDPEANAKHGCRISGRFNWLFDELSQARAEAAVRQFEAAEAERDRLRQTISGVQGALADAATVLAIREDGDYGASIRELTAERDKYREGFCHALFVLWGDGQQKLAAAEADVKRIMRELGIDWNGEQVAPQAEKPT